MMQMANYFDTFMFKLRDQAANHMAFQIRYTAIESL